MNNEAINNGENEIVQCQSEEQPVLSLIQAIKDGVTDPTTLNKELRQQCVEMFLGEGYSISQMAQLLKRSEKTVKRDVNEIRERNALAPDLEQAKRIVGELLMYARAHRNYLMRLARGKEGSVGEKAQAEYYASLIDADVISKLQSLGYLPSAPQAIVGDIVHWNGGNEAEEVASLERQIGEMRKTSEMTGIADAGSSTALKAVEASLAELKMSPASGQQTGGESDEQ